MFWNELLKGVFGFGHQSPPSSPPSRPSSRPSSRLVDSLGQSPEFGDPWRPVSWSVNDKNLMLRYLKEFQPETAEVSELKILIHGPIGAGKSSFVNSINTVIQGYNASVALTNSSDGPSQSFTLKLKTHRLKKGGFRSFYPYVFTDIMGLEEDISHGVQTKDISKILKGHVKDGYTFNPLKPIDEDDPRYISNPGLKDRVHCLVSVLPADKISMISDGVIQKMRTIREKARDLEIPQVVIMSLVDKACPLVNNDLSKIYTSKKIKEKMKECSYKLGVPMNCIFPVLNYDEQVTNNLHMDTLILMAIANIIRFANDYVEDQLGDTLHFGHQNPTPGPSPGPSPGLSSASGPDAELDHPWRPVEWSESNKNQMLGKLKEFQPGTTKLSRIKILLHGPVGAGKSSLINSLNTVLQGQSTTIALVADSTAGVNKSFTLKLKYHRLKKGGPGSFYPFVFTDIMGLEEETSQGVQTKDIIKILKGHVKNGYTFNPVKVIEEKDPKYMRNPSLKHRVHCVVSVVPADKISLISDGIMQKMRTVREKARDLEIPQVVIMTMVDKTCPLAKMDLSKTYTSKKIKEKMVECSHKLGVPMNCIFPVLNYHEQVTNDLHMDILILMAMTNIIRYANDYVEDQVYNASDDDDDDDDEDQVYNE